MIKSQSGYKARGMSNGHIQATKPSNKDEGSSQTVIFGVLGVGLLLIILLYLTFGGSSFRGASIVVGQERISQLSDEKRNIPIKDKYVTVMGQKIFYRECLPVKDAYHTVDILFLHGQKYSSSTWKGLGTLQIFASYGYRTVAVDLPGFGLSKKNVAPLTKDDERIHFIEEFVNNIKLRHVVIIVPSMGGDYGIPVLMKDATNPTKPLDFELNGMVAIAPSRAEKYTKSEYQNVQIPVLILWGERDRSDLAKNANFFLPNIPNSEQMMVSKAQHAAFVGNPQAFHTFILNFLQDRCKLKKEDYGEDYDFQDYDWYASNDYSDYDYDLGDMFDDFTDMTYDYENEDLNFDNQFSDTFDGYGSDNAYGPDASYTDVNGYDDNYSR